MPIIPQTLPAMPGGMNVAYAAQDIDDTEAAYIQDGLLDLPGLNRRRGPLQKASDISLLPRPGSGFVITTNPRGESKFGALTGNRTNGYFNPWNDAKSVTVDLDWPHPLPTEPTVNSAYKYRFVDSKPALGGGAWIGTASEYGANGPLHALALWRGGNLVDYSTGTASVARGSVDVTGSGTSWLTNATAGMFLFATTTDPYTDTLIGTVLSVNSNTSLTLETASPFTVSAGAYTLKSIRGFIPRVTKGTITSATDSTTVEGGDTKFKSQGLDTGAWHLYRASDMSYIGKVSSVNSEIALTLTANAALATADEPYIAIRGDWATADKDIDLTASVNKVGWLTATYAQRQWFANNGAQFDKTYRLWFSDLNDPEAVDLSQDGDWIPITTETDAPESIRALMPTYNALLVIKDTETFAVYGTSPDSFSAKKLEDDGTISTMTVQPYGGGAVWAGRNGVYFYNGVTVENLTAEKFGDVWRNTIRAFDQERYRAWATIAHNHYFLYVEAVDPTISVVKGAQVSTPDAWVMVINLNSRAIVLHTRVHLRGAAELPADEGRAVWMLVNDDLPDPSAGPTLTASAAGGTLSTGTYYYKVTALDPHGETAASPETNVAVTGPTGSVALSWAAIDGATGYRVYRGTAAGSENHYFDTPVASYTDTGTAGTAASPPSTSDFPLGVICDTDALFESEGRDEFGADREERGPDWYVETKKFNAGDDLRLKRNKQFAMHYLAQGDSIRVDAVLGLNNLGRTLTTEFPASVLTWAKLSNNVATWAGVAAQFVSWSDLIDSVFTRKRARFLKKDTHISFRLYQNSLNMARVRMGPFQIGYKLMRPGRV